MDITPWASLVFGLIVISVLTFDFYQTYQPYIKSLIILRVLPALERIASLCLPDNSLITVLKDFRSRKYYVPWRKPDSIIIHSRDHIRELSDTPQLSQRAVYSDIFGFQQTMSSHDTPLDPEEQAPHRYKLYAAAIKRAGVSQLPDLLPYLHGRLETAFQTTLEAVPPVDGWHNIRMAAFMREIATGMLGTYFFGDELYNEPEFKQATFDFYHDVIKYQGALKVVPSFLKVRAYNYITSKGKALNIIVKRLLVEVESVQQCETATPTDMQDLRLFQTMVKLTNGSDYWTSERLVQAVIGIWFAASHQPWINLHFSVLELCSRTEYIAMIRDETRNVDISQHDDMKGLALTDSFLKECMRLNPLDMMAIRRKALAPYTFSKGGPTIYPGQVACVSAHDIMHDSTRYPDPYAFKGMRFVRDSKFGSTNEPLCGTTMTDASKDFPVWGFGARVCPGRWHAALVWKMALVHLVQKYDFELQDPDAGHKWWWETFQLPFESTVLRLQRRT